MDTAGNTCFYSESIVLGLPLSEEQEGSLPTLTFHDETPGERPGIPLGEASWPTPYGREAATP
jgi:hypothetical protein